MGEVFLKLGFDWQIALANLVNFLIIYYLLRNVVFKKIGAAIKERQEKIQKGLDDAQEAESALVVAHAAKEQILKDAYTESKGITEGAEATAQGIIAASKEEGVAEAEHIKARAQKDIARMEADSQKKLENAYVALVLDGVEKVAASEIDRSKSEQFATRLLKS